MPRIIEPAAIGDIFQVRLVGEQEEQETINVWDFTCVGAAADVELTLIVAFINCFIQHMLPVISNKWTLVEVRWQKVGPTLGIEHITTYIEMGPGGAAGDVEPSYVAALISLHTLLGGRSHRGRKYIAGGPESATTGSLLNVEPPNNEFWLALAAFVTCMITAFVHPDPAGGTNLFDVGVYSRKLAGSDNFPFKAAGFTAINEMVPRREVATMRSRKLGHCR